MLLLSKGRLRRRKFVLCLALPFWIAVTIFLPSLHFAKEGHVVQSGDLPVQPIKSPKSLKDFDLFIPTGEELEKNLTFHSTKNLTFNLDLVNMTFIGGHYKPRLRAKNHPIAIIVPYRNRRINLERFLHSIHPFLQKQNVEYSIYVVEMIHALWNKPGTVETPEPEGLFRKTVLMNAGFLEVTNWLNVSCIIFHDVDMVPVNNNNLYYCDNTVRHLAVSITQFSYKKPYDWYIGGVVAFPRQHFITVNGYSNLYIGWGGEDDDMYLRLQACGINITEPSPEVGRYESWPHEREDLLMNMKDYKESAVKRMMDDGLRQVRYELLSFEKKHLYTWIKIKTDPRDIYNEKYLELQPVFLKWN